MAATLSRDEMFAEIIRQDEAKLDVVADTRRMNTKVEGGEVVLSIDATDGVNSFALTPHAQSQVASDLGIPKRYFDRMKDEAPTLLEGNVDHWLHNQPERKLVRGFKPGAGRHRDRSGVAVGQVPPPRQRRDREADLPGLRWGRRVEFHQAAADGHKLLPPGAVPSLEREIAVGDMSAGLEIRTPRSARDPLGSGVHPPARLHERDDRRVHAGTTWGDGSTRTDPLRRGPRADDTAFWLAARDTLKGRSRRPVSTRSSSNSVDAPAGRSSARRGDAGDAEASASRTRSATQ